MGNNHSITNKAELIACVQSLVEFYQILNDPFDTDKSVGFWIDELGGEQGYRITFGYVTRIYPVPPMTDPATVKDPDTGEEPPIIWHPSQGIKVLVKEIYDTFENIQDFKVEYPNL